MKKFLSFVVAAVAVGFPATSQTVMPDYEIPGNLAGAFSAPARLNSSADVITEAQGRVQNTTNSGRGYAVLYGNLATYVADMPSHVVYGENDDIYFYNLLPYATTNTYVKGNVEGDKVVMTLPQTVYYDEEAQNGYNLYMLHLVKNEETGKSDYLIREDVTEVTFTIGEDGSMTMMELDGSDLLGMVQCKNDKFAGYGASLLVVTPFNETPVTVPDGVEVVDNYWCVMQQDNYGFTVSFARDGNDVYLGGLFQHTPEFFVKGEVETAEDGTCIIYIPNNQYLGILSNQYVNLMILGPKEENGIVFPTVGYPADYRLPLVWDREKNTLTADPDFYLMAGYDALSGIFMQHQESFEGVPAAPYQLRYDYAFDKVGFNYFGFLLPATSTEGKLLLTDNLSYVVYVDGESEDDIYCFYADEYGLEEDMYEIPYNMSSQLFWSVGSYRELNFFLDEIDTIGVQSIYRYNGEETRSEITAIDVKTGQTVGVDKISEDAAIVNVSRYDMSGLPVGQDYRGMVIERATYSDGTVKVSKHFRK